MAMVPCPACGEMISDKAQKCVHCGHEFIPKKKICSECSAEIKESDAVCPKCGCPIASANDLPVEVTASKKDKKALGKIALAVSAVIIVIIMCAVGFKVVEAKKAKANAENYYTNFQNIVSTMLSSSTDAESAGNLIKKVWYNSINGIIDSETKIYVRNTNDFNEALNNLFTNMYFSQDMDTLKEKQSLVFSQMKELTNPPEEYSEAYIALQEFYNVYMEFTNLVISPSGSYASFSDSFDSTDDKLVVAYQKVKLYLNN